MSQNKIQKARQAILNEIANTFGSIAMLKAQGAQDSMLRREQLRQRWLLLKLSLLEA